MVKLEADLFGVDRGEDGFAWGGLWEVVVTGGELFPWTGDKDLELVRRGECIWSDSERDSWLLVVACCTREEDEQDLLHGVIWSAFGFPSQQRAHLMLLAF